MFWPPASTPPAAASGEACSLMTATLLFMRPSINATRECLGSGRLWEPQRTAPELLRHVAAHAVVERLHADAKDLRRFFARVALLKRREDQLLLDIRKRAAHGDLEAARVLVTGTVLRFLAESKRGDHRPIGHDVGPLDDVPELAHVAGPVVAPHPIECGRRKLLRR